MKPIYHVVCRFCGKAFIAGTSNANNCHSKKCGRSLALEHLEKKNAKNRANRANRAMRIETTGKTYYCLKCGKKNDVIGLCVRCSEQNQRYDSMMVGW